MNLGYIEITEDYWEVDSTFDEKFEYVNGEKELSNIYIWFLFFLYNG